MTSVTFKLDDLYNTEAEFTLPDGKVISVRILTDAEVTMRDLEAVKAASAVEVELRDEETDRYKDTMGPLQPLGQDSLVAVVMAVASATMREEVQRDHPFRYIPFPDDASEEEKRETVERREEHEAKVRQRRSEELSKRLSERHDELEVLEEDVLLKRAEGALISTEAFNRRIDEFYCQTIYMSCRLDGKPAFDLDAIRKHGNSDGLNETVFRRLTDVYSEIDTADPWVLQKHP